MTIAKLFFWFRLKKLAWLGANAALVALLAYFSGVVRSELYKRLIVTELGAIPSARILFQNDLKEAQMEKLSDEICGSFPVETLRKGYLIDEEMSFEWTKGSTTVSTRLAAVLIGWDLEQKLQLLVESGDETLLLPCLSMHPVEGFCFPEEYAKRLKKKITVRKAVVDDGRKKIRNRYEPSRESTDRQ